MADELPELHERSDEERAVYRHRYQEARDVGLSIVEAQMYADSDIDAAVLRKLVAGGCSVDLIARIIL